MATAVATKSAPLQQKIRRPPPPVVQTGINGVRSSQSSPSPSLSSKRPSSGFKHPPTPNTVNGINGATNGTGPRFSNRRRESQRPGDFQLRQSRGAKLAQSDLEQRARSMPQPYVNDAGYILRKFKKCSPSLIVHLHPTHFRFDGQDGSFSYTSPMKTFLEHLKQQTIPHDMVEDIYAAGVKFYDGNLIVRVHNHKSTTTSSPTNPKGSANDRNVPFSIHNYNEHLTPSPFVPYPASNGDRKSSGEIISANGSLSEADKENYPTQKKPSSSTIITTTVLFPTPRSQQEELRVLANTADPRAPIRKHSQAGNSSRTPASATLPHPSTTLFAVQSTPSSSGPPAKKQKMMVSGTDIPRIQSLMINATAPPICLDVVGDLQEADRLLRGLTDLNHQDGLPPQKTRKRTVAELAVDEAIAAEEQRFMLIMDERLANTTSVATANIADGESGAASFEPRFERFKLLESIKAAHEQRAEEDRLAKQHAAQQAQANAFTARQEMAERAEREKAQREQQARVAAEHAKREAVRHQQYQAQQERLAIQQQQHLANQAQHSHPQTTTAMVPNAQQHMAPASHPPQSSPLVRNLTPHNSLSPVVGNMIPPQSAQAIPMRVTSSSQGGSPARPPSSLQQPHPRVAAAMARQRSHQGSSQGGTPHMPNSTPNLMQATPVTRHVTPTPRISHASPVNPVVSQPPVMNQVGPGMPPQLTPQQQHLFMQQRLHQQQMQNSSPNNPMSTHNMQHYANHQAAAAIAAQQRHVQQQEAYRSSILNQTQQQLAGLQGSPNPNQRMPAPLQHGHPLPNSAPRQMSPQQRAMQEMQHEFFKRAMQQVQQKFGTNPPAQEVQNAKQLAWAQAQQLFTQRVQRQRQQQQQQHMMVQAQMAQMGGNPGMMGMGQGQGQMGGMGGM